MLWATRLRAEVRLRFVAPSVSWTAQSLVHLAKPRLASEPHSTSRDERLSDLTLML